MRRCMRFNGSKERAFSMQLAGAKHRAPPGDGKATSLAHVGRAGVAAPVEARQTAMTTTTQCGARMCRAVPANELVRWRSGYEGPGASVEQCGRPERDRALTVVDDDR